jgi:phage repressor protein C with HTH and peptisase S24 domain
MGNLEGGGRLPLAVVLVRGPSMEPVLRDGDCLLVRRTRTARVGALVVARPLARPELLVVKRAVRPLPEAGAWEVASDNPTVAGLGWTGGAADVLGVVLLRYWPLRRRA